MEALVTLTVAILCSNANIDVSPRCQAPVDFFIVNPDGSAWGALTSGVTFTQSNVVNGYTRLQRYQMENYRHYVSDKGVIYAASDIEALSKYLGYEVHRNR